MIDLNQGQEGGQTYLEYIIFTQYVAADAMDTTTKIITLAVSDTYLYMKLENLWPSNAHHRLVQFNYTQFSSVNDDRQALMYDWIQHPEVRDYNQCIAFDSFTNKFQHICFNLISICALYEYPLIVFIYCYGAICKQIYCQSKGVSEGMKGFRCSCDNKICRAKKRAKKRTLKTTITISLVFVICWMPYYITCVLCWFDYITSLELSPCLGGLINACINSIVCGVFSI
uniref:G-protein coupled receptors family 1 profile domain-containing protein n=1 Tax=Glossina brevipalpis TaxID=37001 RepID=A0A1A9WF81_9MUSC